MQKPFPPANIHNSLRNTQKNKLRHRRPGGRAFNYGHTARTRSQHQNGSSTSARQLALRRHDNGLFQLINLSGWRSLYRSARIMHNLLVMVSVCNTVKELKRAFIFFCVFDLKSGLWSLSVHDPSGDFNGQGFFVCIFA